MAGGGVAAHQRLLVQRQPGVHDAAGVLGREHRHGGVGGRVGVADQGLEPAAQHAFIEAHGIGAVAVETEISG
ncbi:hypothetical protein D3C85_1392850 [compost metagenome]